MSDGGALINVGELSKPATVLIEKISDAVGGMFKPFQIRRVAEAQADADMVERWRKHGLKVEVLKVEVAK